MKQVLSKAWPLVFIPVVFLVVFAYLYHGFVNLTQGHPTLSELSDYTLINFPDGTELIRSESWLSPGETDVWAHVRVPRAQVDGMLRGLPKHTDKLAEFVGVAGKLPETFRTTTDSPEWWPPPTSQAIRAVLIGLPPRSNIRLHVRLRIFIDTESGEMALVYLYWNDGH